MIRVKHVYTCLQGLMLFATLRESSQTGLYCMQCKRQSKTKADGLLVDLRKAVCLDRIYLQLLRNLLLLRL